MIAVALTALALATAKPMGWLPGPTPVVPQDSGKFGMEQVERDETRLIQMRYGQCVVEKHPAAASEFALVVELDGQDARRLIRKVGDGRCLVKAAGDEPGEVQMSLSRTALRYALAEALVRREFSAGQPANLSTRGPILHPELHESAFQPEAGKSQSQAKLDELKHSRELRIADVYISHFGECVVRAAPEDSRTLILTEPVSEQEDEALSKLAPVFGACVDSGINLKLDASVVRGTIALNYYRLAHAAPAPKPADGVTQ